MRSEDVKYFCIEFQRAVSFDNISCKEFEDRVCYAGILSGRVMLFDHEISISCVTKYILLNIRPKS
jgi:hypothetical protein